MEKVCAYCRVSTDSKEQESSFENQRAYFERELSKENGFNLIKIYADKGLTGTVFDREQFLDMLYDAGLDYQTIKGKLIFTTSDREPLFKYICVSNTSRFARNILIVDIIRELRKKKVYIKFMDWGKSTEDDDIDLTLNIFLSMDEQTSRDISSKVRNGFKKLAQSGDKVLTNPKIYGYNYDKKENRLIAIPEEAEVVKLIFELSLKGEGKRRIANYLNENNILRRGKPFSLNGISSILRNVKYAGYNNPLQYRTTGVFEGDKRSITRNKDVNIVKSDRIEAIIDIETFNKVQSIKERNTTETTKRGLNRGKSPYRGKFKCQYCNSNYNRNKDRGYTYYVCANRRRKSSSCSSPNINEELLEKLLDNKCTSFIEDVKNFRESIKEKMALIVMELQDSLLKGDISVKINKLNQQITKLKEKENKLLDLYLNSAIDKDVLELKQVEISENKEMLKSELEILKNNERTYAEQSSFVNYYYEYLDKLITKYYNGINKEDLLKETVNFSLDMEKNIVVQYKYMEVFNKMIDIYNLRKMYSKAKTYDPTDFKI